MALPQRKPAQGQSPNTYQYQVRNTKKVERPGLNTDFQYLNNEEFSDANADPRLLSSQNPTRRTQAERAAQPAANEPEYYKPEQSESVKNQITSSLRKKLFSKRTVKKAIKYARSTTVSGSIVAWGMTLWTIQVMFALMSIVFLGVLGIGDAAVSSSWITSAMGWAVERAVEGGTWLISGTAISVSDIGAGAFILCYMIAFAIGFVTLCAASIQYMMSLIQPLSGENSGTKYVTFLLALIGYATPLLNLFPWFLVFVAVVWKYPK